MIDNLMTAIYGGQVEGEPIGIGHFNVKCSLCAYDDHRTASIPEIVAVARHHARIEHDVDLANVAVLPMRATNAGPVPEH